MRHENFNAEALAEHLEGTCETLQDGIDALYDGMTEEDLTKDDHRVIDDKIFKCSDCGWWFGISDMSGEVQDEQVCNGCVDGD